MSTRRVMVSIELLGPEGVRLEMDSDGWRLLNARSLGQKMLERARALRDRCAECLPPIDPDRLDPVTLEETGLHVAKTLGLRVTHRRFKHHR